MWAFKPAFCRRAHFVLWSHVLVILLCLQGCFVSYSLPTSGSYQSEKGWILTAEKAKALLADGALLLDARKKELYDANHIAGAVQVWWRMFSPTDAATGGTLLKSDAELQNTLRQVGVSSGRVVLVAGDALKGWGEDGRIVWMLRTLGHNKAYMIDGGFTALAQAGMTTTKTTTTPKAGDFTVKRTKVFDVQIQDVEQLLKDKSIVFVDTREAREFRGETPYGETRGGHVPGAVHLWFRDFLDSSGYLLSREKMLSKLKTLGITPDKRVVAYCTGGVRSAWFFVVLTDMGFTNVQNYAGSMWEWSAGPASRYPLVTTKQGS